MFNTMQFAVGLLLAENEKKRLTEKGVSLPNNFVINNSILFGAIGNTAAPVMLLQNEVHKKDKEAFENINTELEKTKLSLEETHKEHKEAFENINEDLKNLLIKINGDDLSKGIIFDFINQIGDEGIKGKYIKTDQNNSPMLNIPDIVKSLLDHDLFQREFAQLPAARLQNRSKIS